LKNVSKVFFDATKPSLLLCEDENDKRWRFFEVNEAIGLNSFTIEEHLLKTPFLLD